MILILGSKGQVGRSLKISKPKKHKNKKEKHIQGNK